ncbi:unnamed protein product [Dovyalis caffra]|uniref:Diacylglycerol O-acyltransferase 3 n=1 Tax=Dovyalis caffra TaxID=77055 RepID=A0AAV1SB86_9ROSI|nr:unnamed protein product [Dovyalis caffra]
METARIIPRPVLRFSGTRTDTHCLKLPLNDLGIGNSRVSFREKGSNGILSRDFSDYGHLKYYASPARCGGKKEKNKEMTTEKKKLKLMKRLSRDLPFFLIRSLAKRVAKATEILLAELQNLRLEQEGQKRKTKEERATLIKTRPKCVSESSASSSSSSEPSSSESSDSDCGEVVSMKHLKSNALNQFTEIESKNTIKGEATQEDPRTEIVLGANDSSPQNLRESSCNIGHYKESCNSDVPRDNRSNGGTSVGASGRKVVICMGGKCKKLGATALLEEFERKVGMEGTVVGCKCMGKCKNGPNVRVYNCPSEAEGINVEDLLNPICIGVGLKDMDVMVT